MSLNGIGGPVLAPRLDHVEMADQQHRLVLARCRAVAPPGSSCASFGPEHHDIRGRKARVAKALRHGLGGGGDVADRVAGVDLDQLLEDVVRQRVSRPAGRMRRRSRGGAAAATAPGERCARRSAASSCRGAAAALPYEFRTQPPAAGTSPAAMRRPWMRLCGGRRGGGGPKSAVTRKMRCVRGSSAMVRAPRCVGTDLHHLGRARRRRSRTTVSTPFAARGEGEPCVPGSKAAASTPAPIGALPSTRPEAASTTVITLLLHTGEQLPRAAIEGESGGLLAAGERPDAQSP